MSATRINEKHQEHKWVAMKKTVW